MANRRGGSGGLTERLVDLEDRVRKIEQGIGFGSLTLRRLRLTDRTGLGKVEIVANDVGLEFRDLVAGSSPLTMPVPEGFGLGSGDGYSIIPFGLSGGLITSISPPWLTLRQATIVRIAATLGTTGTTATTVAVNVDGGTVASLVLNAGDPYVIADVSIGLNVGNRITVSITSVGLSAADLTVQLETV